MRCCVLLLVLIRRLSDNSLKVLKDYSNKKKRKTSQDLQLNEEAKEEDEKDVATTNAKDKNTILLKVENVKQQITALLSFKDALCSGK